MFFAFSLLPCVRCVSAPPVPLPSLFPCVRCVSVPPAPLPPTSELCEWVTMLLSLPDFIFLSWRVFVLSLRLYSFIPRLTRTILLVACNLTCPVCNNPVIGCCHMFHQEERQATTTVELQGHNYYVVDQDRSKGDRRCDGKATSDFFNNEDIYNY